MNGQVVGIYGGVELGGATPFSLEYKVNNNEHPHKLNYL